ncbi:MAG: geranylgeranylglycerol-phosphate geranylgeranyltransferase [bacterium]|jgi:4-hydroxybenzoate polyprenyltransferase|nr:geranylgeranylglycerol-phosphate geranylgeranyltransferase [Chitinophagaceae bacterium]
MKGIQTIKGFFQLIRYPNLLFIALTQFLFYYRIIVPYFNNNLQPKQLLQENDFFLLLIASVLISAAGYIINDYFDIQIDNVNKPERLILGKLIKRRWAMLLHLVLSLAGLFLTAIVAMHLDNLLLLGLNFLSVLMLLLYSSTFKKKLLIGNIIISVLTAWVVGVLFITEIRLNDTVYMQLNQAALGSLYKVTLFYAGFAFIVSLIREVVKDMEDMEGDRRFGCETMPIKWGIPSTKVFVAVWIFVLIGLLAAIAFYAMLNSWSWPFYALSFAMIIQFYFLLKKLYYAQLTADFANISKVLKLIMLAGILSMSFYFIS